MSNQKNGSKHVAPKKKRTNSKFKDFFNRLVAGFKALSKGKKALIISLCSVILVLSIAIGVVLGVILDITKDYNHQEIDDPEIDKVEQIDDEIVNIALFGIDSRSKGFKGLSDSIMVLSINKKTSDIKLVSIMRDSLVKLPEYKGKTYKPNKINSAYSKGGPSYAIKVLNQNFGLDIKEYATVNFYGMAEIIDAVGGIEIDVQSKELDYSVGLNGSLREQAYLLGIKNPPYVTKAGPQVLSGIQAVAWARIRSISTEDGTANDYGRTDRQRVVMEKLLNKALSMSVSEYPALIKAMLPHMETSLGFGEVLALATEVLGKQVNFEQTRIPQQEYVIPDNYCSSYAGSCLYYDINYASKIIHAIIFDDMTQEDYIAQNGIEKNKWYRGTSGGGSTSSGSSKPADTSTSSTGSSSGSSSSESSSSGSSSSGSSSSGSSSSVSSNASNSQGSSSGTSSTTSSENNTPENNENNNNNNNDNNNNNGGGEGNEENNTPNNPENNPPENNTPPTNEGNE